MHSSSDDEAMKVRDWLAATIGGNAPGWIFADEFDSARILHAAQQEGVVALLHQRLLESGTLTTVPNELRNGLTTAAQMKVAQAQWREHHCRAILKQLDKAGIPSLLLKGSALAYWAYPAPYLRECSDIDLLLQSKEDADQAVKILDELQFVLRDKALPGDLVTFEMTCEGIASTNKGLEVDLHWRLSSAPVFAFRFDWDELVASAISLHALGDGARGIAAVPAFMHACMHRVQNMAIGQADTLKWLYDLCVLGDRFSVNDWEDLTRMATERGLAGTCLQAIKAAELCYWEISPEIVRSKLTSVAHSEVMDVSRMDRWWYIQRMNLLALPSTGHRIRWLRQRLVPDSGYLAERYGKENRLWRKVGLRLRGGIKRLRD